MDRGSSIILLWESHVSLLRVWPFVMDMVAVCLGTQRGEIIQRLDRNKNIKTISKRDNIFLSKSCIKKGLWVCYERVQRVLRLYRSLSQIHYSSPKPQTHAAPPVQCCATTAMASWVKLWTRLIRNCHNTGNWITETTHSLLHKAY